MSTLVRSNLNDLLDRSEDPEKMIKQLLIDRNHQMIQAKAQVAAATADEKRLRARAREAQQQADDWQGKAELAIEKGDDELAKQALVRRNTYAQPASGLQEQWQAHSAQVGALRDGLRQLESKIGEAEAKKELLIEIGRASCRERVENRAVLVRVE